MDKNDLAKKWFERADSDFIVAVHVFEDLHPKQIEIACYHCQQSSEKALKGYLVNKEIEPPKTHDLIALCKLCHFYSHLNIDWCNKNAKIGK